MDMYSLLEASYALDSHPLHSMELLQCLCLDLLLSQQATCRARQPFPEALPASSAHRLEYLCTHSRNHPISSGLTFGVIP
jgi:hypothetical protein